MSVSHVETAWNAVVTELEAITTANGYRNNLAATQIIKGARPIDQVTTFPEIQVVFMGEGIDFLSSDWTLYDSLVDVVVQAVVKGDTETTTAPTNLISASESILHDIKRIVIAMALKYVVDADNPWMIDRTTPPEFGRIAIYGPNFVRGVVGAKFKIRVRNLTSAD